MTTTISGTSGVTFPAGGTGNTAGTVVGTTDTQTLTNKTIGAGTASVPPLFLTSGTNLTSATAGAIEYDGKVIYATPLGTQRGIVPTQQYYRLDSALVGANVNTAQNIFGVGCTLSSSTVYEFEIVFALSRTAGAVSHTVGIGFGGTATINNTAYFASGYTNASASALNPYQLYGSSASGIVLGVISSASNTTLTTATTAANEVLSLTLKGTVSINAGGTFIPQYTMSAAAGGAFTAVAGSYIRIAPISASGANTSVGTWA